MTKKNKEEGNFSELSFKFWSFVIPLTFEIRSPSIYSVDHKDKGEA
jgi:hypothetical protein